MPDIPPPTVTRLPRYLRALDDLHASDTTISSEVLGELVGADAAQVRQDLKTIRARGIRGRGYPVDTLRRDIRNVLKLDMTVSVVIVGAGHLGTALVRYRGFNDSGFNIAGLVDSDRRKTGTLAGNVRTEHLDDLQRIVRERGASMAMLAVPDESAQEIADRLVSAGITSILSFAAVALRVPAAVRVRRVDLVTELRVLNRLEFP